MKKPIYQIYGNLFMYILQKFYFDGGQKFMHISYNEYFWSVLRELKHNNLIEIALDSKFCNSLTSFYLASTASDIFSPNHTVKNSFYEMKVRGCWGQIKLVQWKLSIHFLSLLHMNQRECWTCNPRAIASIPSAGNLKKLLIWMKIHGLPQNHNKDTWVRW